MDLNTAQRLIISSLTREAPRLNDYSQGSIVYTLTRAMASSLSDIYYRIDQLQQNYYIGSSQGEFLTELGDSLGYQRNSGTPSKGYVLVANQVAAVTSIPAQLVLTDPVTTLQFIIQTQDPTAINEFYETRFPVISSENTSEANLLAGTELISAAFPNLSFVVGTYRTGSGKICGDLTGGSDSESDTQLRNRIVTGLSNANFNTNLELQRFLSLQGDVNEVKIQTPTGGAIVVWVGSPLALTPARLVELNDLLENRKPAGVLSEVKQLSYVTVTFKVRLYDSEDSSIDRVKLIKSEIQAYINTLELQEPLILGSVLEYLTQRLGYPITFLAPKTDIYLDSIGQVFRVGEVEVTYVQ